MGNSNLPGKLGNANATLDADPRLDPRIKAALEFMGDFAPGVDPIPIDASYEESLEFAKAMEAAGEIAHPAMLEAMPKVDSVVRSTEVIKGVDGNDITLHIVQPAERAGDLPAIVHTHGGGMVLATAADPMYIRWRDSLAETGLVVVGVEFRNGGGKLGPHPFPAGLNDCAAGAQWTIENKARLGISKVVISGESGGGNLCSAVALKANREGWIGEIDGVYAMCPYVSGAYANPPPELLSLVENDDYMLSCQMMVPLARIYDPSGVHATEALAWPLHASPEDLAGLPPHVVSVNELDPLRDEGIAYLQKLLAAGVSAIGRSVLGTPHGGDMGFADVTPDIYQETVRSIHGFAASL